MKQALCTPSIIRTSPEEIAYSQPFELEFEEHDPDPLAYAVLMRQGFMTHSFNFDQRGVTLPMACAGEGILRLEGPDTPNHAAPGSYMLFLVSQAGLASERSAWVKLA